MTKDVFYIKTSDDTAFAVYDLSVNDDVNKIDFTYSCVDEAVSSDIYKDEVYDIVSKLLTSELKKQWEPNN